MRSDLSRREREIMEVLYRLGEATAKQIVDELPDRPANANGSDATPFFGDQGRRGSSPGTVVNSFLNRPANVNEWRGEPCAKCWTSSSAVRSKMHSPVIFPIPGRNCQTMKFAVSANSFPNTRSSEKSNDSIICRNVGLVGHSADLDLFSSSAAR